MSYEAHKKQAQPLIINCAVLTISDTRDVATDKAGKLITEALLQDGHRVFSYSIIKDEAETIKSNIKQLLDTDELQVVITSGSTGVGGRDVAIEAVLPLLDKELTGFGELFRWLSYQEIGSPSMLTRATAGIAQGKIIFCLPGSPNAVQLAMQRLILPELRHLVWEVHR